MVATAAFRLYNINKHMLYYRVEKYNIDERTLFETFRMLNCERQINKKTIITLKEIIIYKNIKKIVNISEIQCRVCQ